MPSEARERFVVKGNGEYKLQASVEVIEYLSKTENTSSPLLNKAPQDFGKTNQMPQFSASWGGLTDILASKRLNHMVITSSRQRLRAAAAYRLESWSAPPTNERLLHQSPVKFNGVTRFRPHAER